MSLDRTCGQAIVIDLTFLGEDEPITVALLEEHAPPIEEGDVALCRTDWTEKAWGRFPDYYMRSPYCEPEAAGWLVDQGAKVVGFDCFSERSARAPGLHVRGLRRPQGDPRPRRDPDPAAHRAVAAAGRRARAVLRRLRPDPRGGGVPRAHVRARRLTSEGGGVVTEYLLPDSADEAAAQLAGGAARDGRGHDRDAGACSPARCAADARRRPRPRGPRRRRAPRRADRRRRDRHARRGRRGSSTRPRWPRRRAAVGGPALRNMATIGGNLLAGWPYGDVGVRAARARRGRRARRSHVPARRLLGRVPAGRGPRPRGLVRRRPRPRQRVRALGAPRGQLPSRRVRGRGRRARGDRRRGASIPSGRRAPRRTWTTRRRRARRRRPRSTRRPTGSPAAGTAGA